MAYTIAAIVLALALAAVPAVSPYQPRIPNDIRSWHAVYEVMINA